MFQLLNDFFQHFEEFLHLPGLVSRTQANPHRSARKFVGHAHRRQHVGVRAAIALGRRLVLRLQGDIAAWPEAWPALPPPLSASATQLSFALDYADRTDFSGPATLQVKRDDTALDARFRLPDVLAWLDADAGGSPLPPLQGHLRTPRIDIAGARLEGVDIEFDDPGIAVPPPSP